MITATLFFQTPCSRPCLGDSYIRVLGERRTMSVGFEPAAPAVQVGSAFGALRTVALPGGLWPSLAEASTSPGVASRGLQQEPFR